MNAPAGKHHSACRSLSYLRHFSRTFYMRKYSWTTHFLIKMWELNWNQFGNCSSIDIFFSKIAEPLNFPLQKNKVFGHRRCPITIDMTVKSYFRATSTFCNLSSVFFYKNPLSQWITPRSCYSLILYERNHVIPQVHLPSWVTIREAKAGLRTPQKPWGKAHLLMVNGEGRQKAASGPFPRRLRWGDDTFLHSFLWRYEQTGT